MITEPVAWRRYLDDLIRRMSSAEKQRLYAEIGVTRTTVQRWRNGENTPDPSHVHQLLNALSEEGKQLRTLMQDDPMLQMPEEQFTDEPLIDHIPQHVYEEVLRLARDAPDQFWLLGGTILYYALAQLGATEQAGLEMVIAGCMPPRDDGKIRSLRALGVRGMEPWRTDFHMKEMLFGVESLAGYAAMRRHSMMVPDIRDPHLALPMYDSQEHEQSCAAAPLIRGGKVAGTLLVTSSLLHFFTEEKLKLLERYADLLCLAFSHQDFVDISCIDLTVLPSRQTKHAYFSSFRQRVHEEYTHSVQQGSLQALTHIEMNVRQKLEDELLQLASLAENQGTV